MEPLVCVVTEPWIGWFQLPALDCEHHVNCLDITCSRYYNHISARMYSGLKSLQIATSFQTWRPLSLAFVLLFFVLHTKNHATYFHSEKLDFEIKFFFKKNILLFSMLPSCRVIFPHPPHNVIFNVHNVKVIAEQIGLPIRKLS